MQGGNMKKLVLISAFLNFCVALCLPCPWLWEKGGIPIPDSSIWLWFPATLVLIIGIIVAVCSRDLENRAPIIYWVGVCRIIVSALIAGFFYKYMGPLVFGLVAMEWFFAFSYFIGLSKMLKASFFKILFDRYSGR
jgi:hypothetical protein